MNDRLAKALYDAWNKFGEGDSWGNIDSETREKWERVAEIARKHVHDDIMVALKRGVERFNHEILDLLHQVLPTKPGDHGG